MNNENRLYVKISMQVIAITFIVMTVCQIMFHSWNITLGIMIGSLTRLIGFWIIVVSTKKWLFSFKARSKAISNYLLRFSFYGMVLVVSMIYNLNIIAILIGLLLFNIVVIYNEIIKTGR